MKKLIYILAAILLTASILVSCGEGAGGGGSERYFVYYNGNENTDGEAPVDIKLYNNEEIVTVKDQGSLEREGYYFYKWSDMADGSGGQWEPLDTFPIRNNVILYAQWEEYDVDEYDVNEMDYNRVFYYGNDSTGGKAPVDNVYYVPGSQATLKDQGTLVRDGYVFDRWTTQYSGGGTTYLPGTVVTMDSNRYLYPVWVVAPPAIVFYTVTFVTPNANAPAPRLVQAGIRVVQPPTPVKTGDYYNIKLRGWSTSSTTYNAWNFNNGVTGNMTLYAWWEPYAIGETGPGGGKIVYRNGTGIYLQPYTVWQAGKGYPMPGKTVHYLEVAPQAAAGFDLWNEYPKGETHIPTNTIHGYGMQNTWNILKDDATAPAALYCVNYRGGGKDDWFLPSLGDMYDFNMNWAASGYPSGYKCWTSTQASELYAYYFILGGSGSYNKLLKDLIYPAGGGENIVPMRAF